MKTVNYTFKIHVQIESADGQPLAEIKEAPVFSILPSQETWQQTDLALNQFVDVYLRSPIRGIISGQFRLETAETTRERPEYLSNLELPEEIKVGLRNLFMEIEHQRQL